jgi:tetratricopeptide (TPR) repeat protein
MNKYREAARAAFKKKDWVGGIEIGKLLRSESKKISYIDGEVSGLNIAGVGYARNGDHPRAMIYFDSAVKASSGSRDKSILEKIYANRGLEYDTLKQFSKAIDDLITSARYAESAQDYIFLAMVYYSIGQAYAGLNLLSDPKNNKDKSKWVETELYFKKHFEVLREHKEAKNRYLHYTY